MNADEIKKQDKKWILLGLILVAFFAVSLLISFNSGFRQGVYQVVNCEKNGYNFSIEEHSFDYECKKINNNKANGLYINFSGDGLR